MSRIADHIKTLVHIPSPTGFTNAVTQHLLSLAAKKGITAEQTRKGAVIYRFEGEKSDDTVMFAAHIDTLGAMISRIDEDGVFISPLGSFPPSYIIGDYCTIHTFGGEQIKGTILPKNPAFHVNKALKSDYKPDFSNLTVRVDEIDLPEEITVGNFVTFDPKFEVVNGFIKTRHLDDKASCAVLLAIAESITSGSVKPRRNVEFFFNVTEETGQGVTLLPEYVDDLIVVDMGVVGEGCTGDEYSVCICAKDTGGPYNYELTRELAGICSTQKIEYKLDVFPLYSSDGTMILRAGNNARVALFGPGVSASHGYERTHETGLENTRRLIEAVIPG